MGTFRAICVGGPLDKRIVESSGPIFTVPVSQEADVSCVPSAPSPEKLGVMTVQYHYTPRYDQVTRCEVLAQWRLKPPVRAER